MQLRAIRILLWAILAQIAALAQPSSPTIVYGVPATGLIEDCAAASPTNLHTLTGAKDDRVVIHLTETNDFGGICRGVATCAFDQCVELRDSQGAILASACTALAANDCGNQTHTPVGPVTLPRDGQYVIAVRDANGQGRGRYALAVERTLNPAGAEPLSPGAPKLANIQTAAQIRTFTFHSPADTFAKIEMKRLTGAVVPRLALYGPSGDAIALPSDGRIPNAAITQSGQHTLFAFGSDYSTGSTQVLLQTSQFPLSAIGPVISQIADGAGWQTTLILANTSSETIPYSLRFWNDAGSTWRLALNGPAEGTLLPGASRTLSTLNRDAATQQGWAEVSAPKPLDVLAIFRSASGQEATSPGTMPSRRFILPFDNTEGRVTSLALLNANGDLPATVTVTFRDENGAVLNRESLTLPPKAHQAYALPTRFPPVAGRRGTAEIGADIPDLSGLGLRFSPGGIFTSIPVIRVE